MFVAQHPVSRLFCVPFFLFFHSHAWFSFLFSMCMFPLFSFSTCTFLSCPFFLYSSVCLFSLFPHSCFSFFSLFYMLVFFFLFFFKHVCFIFSLFSLTSDFSRLLFLLCHFSFGFGSFFSFLPFGLSHIGHY